MTRQSDRGTPKPLYRRVNTRTRGVRHGKGGAARWTRNTKPGRTRDSFRQGLRHGLDYTPLYRFLLSRVDQPFPPTHAEALARLPEEAPIWHLVARPGTPPQDYVRTGESTYFSGLYVDQDDILRKTDPTIDETTLAPSCACCTHSFNGTPFTRSFAH